MMYAIHYIWTHPSPKCGSNLGRLPRKNRPRPPVKLLAVFHVRDYQCFPIRDDGSRSQNRDSARAPMRMHLAEVRKFPVSSVASEVSNISERVVLMCGSSLFAGLTAEECSQIALYGKMRTFAQDELLFMQGQPI